MLIVYPAYGREYKNRQEVAEDWFHGRDFVYSRTNQFCSIRDFPDKLVLIKQGSSAWTMTSVREEPVRHPVPQFAESLLEAHGATDRARSWAEWEDVLRTIEELVNETLEHWHIQILLELKKQVKNKEFKELTLTKP